MAASRFTGSRHGGNGEGWTRLYKNRYAAIRAFPLARRSATRESAAGRRPRCMLTTLTHAKVSKANGPQVKRQPIIARTPTPSYAAGQDRRASVKGSLEVASY